MSTSPPPGNAPPTLSREDPTRPDARVNDARRVAISRTAWIAARARNASRHAWPIALVGVAALLATVLILILVPRQADRAMRMQLERIPAARDTIALQRRLDTLAARYGALRRADSAHSESLRPGDLRADNDAVVDAPSRVESSTNAPNDAELTELRQRLNRARAVPLTESYRDLALARALAGDARVRMLADSLDALDRERSAYAALGGPDAHYAALTARLNAFGQRLVRIAAARAEALAPERAPEQDKNSAGAGAVTRTDSTLVTRDSATMRSDAIATTGDSTMRDALLPVRGSEVRVQGVPVAPDSVSAALREMSDTLSAQMQRATRELVDAQQENLALESRRAPIQARLGRTVPPVAMLFAALIVGLSIGYLVAFVRELRRPTVGDEIEVERRTNARVVSTRYAKVRGAPLPDAGNPSYALLHLSLTGMGEVAHTVHVIAERPFVASVVALNLGVSAARESRAALVVEDAMQPRMLDDWLRTRTIARSSSGITTVAIERDLTLDLLRATGPGTARPARLDRYDITLLPSNTMVPDTDVPSNEDPSDVGTRQDAGTREVAMSDVVICARVGTTPLSWLDAVVRDARAHQCRVRAVLLWSSEQPSP